MASGTWFARFAKATARVSGHAATFGFAVLVIVAWAVTGPLFHFSDTWQLVINTGTTIVTFLMVFLIQNTQNRDSVAMQIKLDELLRAMKGAQTAMDNDIKLLRFLAQEMTQADLGKRVGLTRQTIAAIEQGRYSPTLEAAFRIAHARTSARRATR